MKRLPAATRRASGRGRGASGWLWLPLVGVLGVAGCVTDRYPEGTARGARSSVAALGQHIHVGEDVNAYYRVDGAGAVTAVLVPGGTHAATGDYPSLTVLRLLWNPKPGATPQTRTATNAVVRHMVFSSQGQDPQAQGVNPSGESLGLFTGAGFVKLSGDAKDGVVELVVREADLQLTDASSGYTHPLRRTALTARVQASRNDAAVSRWIKAAGVRASAALGYPAWVRAAPPAESPEFSGDLLMSSESGVAPCFSPSSPLPSGV